MLWNYPSFQSGKVYLARILGLQKGKCLRGLQKGYLQWLGPCHMSDRNASIYIFYELGFMCESL